MCVILIIVFCRFAIYIPLFLPISIPLLLSALTAFKWLVALAKGKDVQALQPLTESTAQKNTSASIPDDEAVTTKAGQGGGEGRIDGGEKKGGGGGEEKSGGGGDGGEAKSGDGKRRRVCTCVKCKPFASHNCGGLENNQ